MPAWLPNRATAACASTRPRFSRPGLLVDRAVAAGELRADARADDLLDLAAAIAWVGEHSPPDPQRPSRLLHLCLAGARP